MSAVLKNLHQVWDQLRSQKTTRQDYLEQVQIKNLRGIQDLRVSLPYPVCALAGANGCGKSTVLFALASAYAALHGKTQHTPARLFPAFKSLDSSAPRDELGSSEITFSYTDKGQALQMAWKRGAEKWNRSFFGRKRGRQPQREVYLHTLSKLTNPGELDTALQLGRRELATSDIDSSNILFAQRILGYRYSRIVQLRGKKRDLLFAERTEPGESPGGRYSEFHMSAGERAVIRLSIRLSKIHNALVLIDEVEAGLHPHVQQVLMLELQRLALRNQLQIVVTTHSPVVLDTVPLDARVFLERTDSGVVRREAYRDLIQKALYGRSQEVLSFLCEDEASESLLRGVLDVVGPRVDWLQNDIEVGRDTGKDQFPAHLDTLAHFRRLDSVVFVLDGDGEDVKRQLEQRAQQTSQRANVVLLPGGVSPEMWAWRLLETHPERYSEFLGLDATRLSEKIHQLDDVYSNAADRPTQIFKNKLQTLAEENSRTPAEIFRRVGKMEAEMDTGAVYELAQRLDEIIRDWRVQTR